MSAPGLGIFPPVPKVHLLHGDMLMQKCRGNTASAAVEVVGRREVSKLGSQEVTSRSQS